MILGRLRRRPTLAAGLIYTALAILLLLPGLLPGRTISTADSLRFAPPWAAGRPAHLTRISNNELGDAVVQFQPLLAFARDALPHAPLWNPYLMSGRPLLADDQSAVLSPFSVPAYILPLLTSLGWSAVLKLVAAALGVFVLARALGQRFAAALLAGLVYGFSFWMVSWLAYPHSGVWALFGWVLWAVEGALVRPGPRSAGVLGLAHRSAVPRRPCRVELRHPGGGGGVPRAARDAARAWRRAPVAADARDAGVRRGGGNGSGRGPPRPVRGAAARIG